MNPIIEKVLSYIQPHTYCLYYVFYDSEGDLCLTNDILYTCSFAEEPSAKELKEVIGVFFKKNHNIIKHLMYEMFSYHDTNQHWGIEQSFLPIEIKIAKSIEGPNNTINYDRLMEILTSEEAYDMFFDLINETYHTKIIVKKLEIRQII